MATIVGGFILPHDPLVFAAPQAAKPAQREVVMGAFDRIRVRIAELRADTAIVVGADHYILFGPSNLPSMLIGIGDVEGPIEKLPGIEQGPMPNNEPLARHILQCGQEQGFDWSVAKSLTVDHSIGVAARLCALPNAGMRVIPIYVASGVEPMIRTRRAYDLGRLVQRAVASWPLDERVVVIGSGGISHWVGMPEMGRVNEAFDRMVLDCVVKGDAETLIGLRDEEVIAQAGNGGLEIRHFLLAMGAVPACRGEVIAYEPVAEWITGLGFAELRPGT